MFETTRNYFAILPISFESLPSPPIRSIIHYFHSFIDNFHFYYFIFTQKSKNEQTE